MAGNRKSGRAEKDVHHLKAVDLVVGSAEGPQVFVEVKKCSDEERTALQYLFAPEIGIGDPCQQVPRWHRDPVRDVPPLKAKKLLSLLAGPGERAHLLGDLEEEFHAACDRFGVRFASRQYWIDVFWSVLPILTRRFVKILGVGAIGAYFRRKLGL
jgi:hypothetical protein